MWLIAGLFVYVDIPISKVSFLFHFHKQLNSVTLVFLLNKTDTFYIYNVRIRFFIIRLQKIKTK